jgi:hypothetical protein
MLLRYYTVTAVNEEIYTQNKRVALLEGTYLRIE